MQRFSSIWYKKPNKTGNFNLVAKSEGARPVMILNEFPNDIDYARYIKEATDILDDLGFTDL